MPESETPVRSGVASLVLIALIGIISTSPNVPLDVSPVLISGLVMMLFTTAAHFIQHTLFVDGPPPKVTSTTLAPAPAPTPALLLARANILKLSTYRCARDDYTSGVLLDANENSLGPSLSPCPSKGKGASSLALERYPDPHQVELKSAFAELRSATIPTATATATANATFGPLPPRVLTHRNIFAGVGSDEAIDLLIRIFASPGPPPRGDSVLITPPTYGMYEVCSDVNDVTVLRAPLTAFDFDLDVEVTVRTALKHASKLVFICSPGNPTAKAIDLDKITAVATALRDTSIVVVDEAYVDFSGKQSAVQLIFDHPNVVVLQTLSKAFGLAGVRCGFAIGEESLIGLMSNVKAPYNLNSLTSSVARTALSPKSLLKFRSNLKLVLLERDRVAKRLTQLDFVKRVCESDSNFLLFELEKNVDAERVYKIMAAEKGVVVRFRGNELFCTNCLRVSVGTKGENGAFLRSLEEVVKGLK